MFWALALALLPLAAPAARAQDQAAPPMQSPPYDPSQVTIPAAPPRAALGAPIYAENCAPCHGAEGRGDGARAPQLPVPPPAFADAAAVWERTPAELFHTTKFGRLQNLMPPFGLREDGGGYTDEEIWQAVAYAWSLHTSPGEIAAGEALYAASCASCHGEEGRGDGPEANTGAAAGADTGAGTGAAATAVATAEPAAELPDFSDPQYVAFRSQADWVGGWQAAHPEVGGEWSLTDQSNTLDYVRTFSYYPPWQTAYAGGSGVIEGQVVQGTPGEPLPANAPIVLEAFLGFAPLATFTSTVGADGAFRFDGLATDPTINYLATVAVGASASASDIAGASAGGISYSSDILTLAPLTPTLTADIVVYGTTDDPSAVRINRSHWIVDQQPGAVLGGAIYIFGNAGDRTYTGRSVEGVDVPVTVGIEVPPGAEDVALDGGALGERFFRLGDVIYDTLPLLPGEGTRQVVVRYVLPFAGTEVAMAQAFLHPVDQLSLLVASLPGVQVEAPALELMGPRDMGGQEYLVLNKTDFAPQSIDVRVRGLLAPGSPDPRAAAAAAEAGAAGAAGTAGAAGAAGTAGSTGSGTAVAARTVPAPLESWATWAMIGLVGAALLGVVGWTLQRGALGAQHSKASLVELRETLLQRMAQLDDLHAMGQIGQNEWMRQRSYLKAQLVDVMQKLESGT